MSETETPTTTAIAPRPPSVAMGIAPTTIEEGYRLAKLVSESSIVPPAFRGKAADALIAIQASLEVGLPWLQGIQGSAVINGRHGFFGETFLAIILTSPLCLDHDEYYLNANGNRVEVITPDDLKSDLTTAVCAFTRKGRTRPIVRTFSIAQAKKAGLLAKEGPWQQYPDRQLRMRARAIAGRDAFPDVLKGMRPVEELHDIPPEDPPIAAEPIAPRRASEAAAQSSAREEAPAVTIPAPPEEPPPPAPRIPPAAAHEMRPVWITHTCFVTPKEEEPYYEIAAAGPDRARHTFRTREEALYKEALSFEGTPHAVVIGYTLKYTKARRTIVHVLESLAIDETTPPAPPPEPAREPDLFSR